MSCSHPELLFGKHGQYCSTCGALVELGGEEQPRPVRPTYYEALADSRILGWRDMGDMPPTDAPYYVAWHMALEDVWQVIRMQPGTQPPPWATHWHHDALGLPLAARPA